MRRICATLLGLILVAHVAPARAEAQGSESTLGQIGYGTGAIVGSAVYFPFKAAFCILGGIGSGVTLVVSGRESARRVGTAACRGTWVITPDIVKGRETVKFVGRE